MVSEPHPWGACITDDCAFVGIRCLHLRCDIHCAEKCKDNTGTKTHSERSKHEVTACTPTYNPTTPNLVAVMKLREAA